MTDIDELTSPGYSPDPDRLRKGAAIYQRLTGKNSYADIADNRQPRVSWGANTHHTEFDRLNSYRIRYAGGSLELKDIPRDYRDEVAGRDLNLLAMRRDYISLAGGTPPALNEPQQIITRSDGSSDYPSLVNNIMTQEMIDGFNNSAETWQHWVPYLPAKDFRAMDVIRGASVGSPDVVEENAELPEGHLYDDGKEADSIKSHTHRELLTQGKLK